MFDIRSASASERHFALASLSKSDGWALFLDRYRQKVIGEVETQALDPATPPDKTEVLKKARQFLIQEFQPDKILNSMIVAAKSEKLREDKETAP